MSAGHILRQLSLGEHLVVALSAYVENPEGSARERLHRGEVDRTRAQGASEDKHAGLIPASPKRARAETRSTVGGGIGRPVTR